MIKMLRESSVPYSSLPQEEGEQTYVSTRKSTDPNAPKKNRIIRIIVATLIICAVPLMIIAPLVLSRGGGGGEASLSFLPHLGGQDTNNDALKNENQDSLTNAPTPSSHLLIPPAPAINNNTDKPSAIAPPATTTTSSSTTTTSTTTTTKATTTPTTTTTTTTPTTTTTTTPAPITAQPILIISTTSVLKPTVKVPIGEDGKNQTGDATTGTQTTKMPADSQKGPEEGSGSGTLEAGDNDDYSDTATQTITNMMTNFMSKHEWWTLVGLVVASAVALAMLIGALTLIIHNRCASRNRKMNLQKVITDLQSRDKVVLLNSEESEDEA